jgi:hypothetical protein
MTPLGRTRICLLFNLITLGIIVTIVSIVGNGSYLKFGPSKDVNIIGVVINTWTRWAIVNTLIIFISVSDTFINEWGLPYLYFRIYNPDTKIVTDVSPIELQVLANSMYFCYSVKNVIYTLCYVTQIDFAIVRVLSGEIASIFTIRGLIKDKKFIKNTNNAENSKEDTESLLKDINGED